jgi:hypothetical protein
VRGGPPPKPRSPRSMNRGTIGGSAGGAPPRDEVKESCSRMLCSVAAYWELEWTLVGPDRADAVLPFATRMESRMPFRRSFVP